MYFSARRPFVASAPMNVAWKPKSTQEKWQSELCATEPDQPAQRAYDCAACECRKRSPLLFCAHRANDKLQLRRWQTASVTEVLMRRFIEGANRAQAVILPEFLGARTLIQSIAA